MLWVGQGFMKDKKYISYCIITLRFFSLMTSIQLLESPIPAAPAPAPAAPSQKASSDDISGTKRGSIDPLVSNRPEKDSKKEN